MADLRITDLPVLPEADVAATDVIPVADVSASETKKVTTKDLIEAGVALIDNGSIPAAKLSAISPASLGTSTLAAQFIAGPTATTGTFAARVIAAGDLPIATAAVTGTVSVGAGLAISSSLYLGHHWRHQRPNRFRANRQRRWCCQPHQQRYSAKPEWLYH